MRANPIHSVDALSGANSFRLAALATGGHGSAEFGFLGSGKNASQTGVWLPDMDLNHDKQIQSLLCYRYTIGQ